ncbi:MAG: DUF4214 domain-containing protein [Clostridia bacterium]|nr:DUF4214 domain-containing protein [Clostridia bacterium]
MKLKRITATLMTIVMLFSVINVNILKTNASSVDMDGIKAFVTRMYEVCLDREPEQSGLDGWAQKLADKEATGCSVAYGFVFSPEFIGKNPTNEQFTTYMYTAFFGRKPDEDGFKYWVDLLNTGATKESVFCGFANSQEFSNLCRDYGVVRGYHIEGEDYNRIALVNLFVERLYNVVLDRTCDDIGMAGWTIKLVNHEESGCSVAYGFVFSPEFLNRHTCNNCFVEILYNAFLGRASDEGGKVAWVSELNSGTPREVVFNGFAGSLEFSVICDSYGIEPGSLNISNPSTHAEGICTICGHVNTASDGGAGDNGNGSGSGNGTGNGNGTENGSGAGNGSGNGSGNSSGNGSGSTSGNGNDSGTGTGTGSGSGSGNGNTTPAPGVSSTPKPTPTPFVYEVGDRIEFGEYAGETVVWKVLDKINDEYILLAEQGLETIPFNSSSTAVKYENSTIRSWLNDVFYVQTFDDEEKAQILTSTFSNEGGSTATLSDKVYLLSSAETEKYLPTNYARLCYATDYAVSNGAYLYLDTYGATGATWWWLRNSGKAADMAMYVRTSGGINKDGYSVTDSTACVRPVIRVKFTGTTSLLTSKPVPSYTFDYEVGDHIRIGNYKNQNITWTILEKQGDKYLVITDYIIEARQFADKEGAAWDESSIREWLNKIFYSGSFTGTEQKLIQTTHVINDVEHYNYHYNMQGEETDDKIFLLSYNETDKYFATGRSKIAPLAPYLELERSNVIYESYSWWVRTCIDNNRNYAISSVGGVDWIDRDDISGVRPAMWVDLEDAICVAADVSTTSNKYAPGDKITLGNYGGEKISWIVLEAYHGKYLVISEKGLDTSEYAQKLSETSQRLIYPEWLRSFYDAAFTDNDKKKIIEVPSEGGISPREEGSVRLLTEDEFRRYIEVPGLSLCYPSQYAIDRNAWVDKNNGCCAWWLRECRATSDFFMMVYATSTGTIEEYDDSYTRMCMRPVMWVTGV